MLAWCEIQVRVQDTGSCLSYMRVYDSRLSAKPCVVNFAECEAECRSLADETKPSLPSNAVTGKGQIWYCEPCGC